MDHDSCRLIARERQGRSAPSPVKRLNSLRQHGDRDLPTPGRLTRLIVALPAVIRRSSS